MPNQQARRGACSCVETPLLICIPHILPCSPPHSAQKQERAAAAITAGVISGVGAMMASPLVAEAAVTPSLK